ncbi:MAG: IclR family transcriptional regulator [Terrimesophilobacter sp.]
MVSGFPEPRTSFERGLAIMVRIATTGEVSVEELARDLDIPTSTVYRYIRSLRELSLIEESHGNYTPGWRLLDLSGQHLTHTRLAEIGVSVLESIVEATSETAVLAVRSGLHAICLKQVSSPHALRYAFKINQLLPLHAGAGQRTLLAYAPEAVIEKVLEQSFPRFTERTPSRGSLMEYLKQIRETGYAISRGELSPGSIAIARPVFSGGEIVCSLTVAGPEDRCSSNAWSHRALQSLRTAADLLTEAMEPHQR